MVNMFSLGINRSLNHFIGVSISIEGAIIGQIQCRPIYRDFFALARNRDTSEEDLKLYTLTLGE